MSWVTKRENNDTTGILFPSNGNLVIWDHCALACLPGKTEWQRKCEEKLFWKPTCASLESVCRAVYRVLWFFLPLLSILGLVLLCPLSRSASPLDQPERSEENPKVKAICRYLPSPLRHRGCVWFRFHKTLCSHWSLESA